MTSQTKSAFLILETNHFVFGPKDWAYRSSGANKAQASAIRPVLVSDDGQEDPVYAPFANIKQDGDGTYHATRLSLKTNKKVKFMLLYA